MSRRTKLASLAAISIAAPAIILLYLQANVANAPVSGPETDNRTFPPLQKALADTPDETDPTTTRPDNALDKNDPTKTLKNGGVRSWPINIENRIWEYFSHSGRSDIISINSVECTDTECTIEFYSTDINPKVVEDFGDLTSDMMHHQKWNVVSGSMWTKETGPGVRAFVIKISNVPDDMEETRRSKEAGLQLEADEDN